MNLKFLRPVWLVTWLATLLLATTRLGAAIPPAENLLPTDTLFLFTTPDCHAFRAAMTQSPQFLLWNDPAMRPFRDKFVAKWNDLFAGPLTAGLGVDLASFMELPQGQFTIAMTRNGWDGMDESQSVGWLLLLDAKDKSDLLATTLQDLKQKWAADGKALRTETVHGIPFSIVPLSTNDMPGALGGLLPNNQPVQELGVTPKPPKPTQMVVGRFQSLLIVGNSIKAVEPVVARLTGGSVPTLADNSLFEEDKASQFRDSPLFYSWLNAHTLFDVLSHISAPAPNPDVPTMFPVPSAATILAASGLTGLKSASFTYRESHEGTMTTLYLSAPESTRQGVLKMLAVPQKDASPPPFVPADAAKFWRWRLDGQKMWAELEKSLDAISPQISRSLNLAIDLANSMAQQKNGGFDLRRDLFGNLGDDWISYDKAPSANAADINQSSSIFLIAVANPESTLLAMKTAIGFKFPQEGAPASREFLGHTITALALNPQVSETGTSTPNTVYCTIGSGYLAMSGDLSMLQDFLRSAGKPPRPLMQMPGLADAMQQVGGMGNGLFGYQDNRAVMRTAFSELKKSAISQPTAPVPANCLGDFINFFTFDGAGDLMTMSMGRSVNDWFDCSLLPDYDQMSKYFYFSGFTSTTTPSGITFKGFCPRPPKLN